MHAVNPRARILTIYNIIVALWAGDCQYFVVEGKTVQRVHGFVLFQVSKRFSSIGGYLAYCSTRIAPAPSVELLVFVLI
jgi:hypothetical protein